jgi:hypothetical protein
MEVRNSEQREAARDWFDGDDLERDGEPVLVDTAVRPMPTHDCSHTQSSSVRISAMGGNTLTSTKGKVSAPSKGQHGTEIQGR